MARVYNPTRLMLDANTMSALIDKGREREDSRNRMIASGIAGILRGGQEAIERGNRRAMMEGGDWNDPSEWGDKEYEAAKESFINTGDVSALNSYRQRKLQEQEMKMREEDTKARKKLAEMENARGADIASKERESQIDELMTNLKKSLVQRDSESVTPDVRAIANIDVAYYRNKLKNFGIELSDDDIEKIGGRKKAEENNEEVVETGSEDISERNKDETLFGKIMSEQDISARKRILKDAIEKAKRNGISDAEKAELADAAEEVSNATDAAKRDDEFIGIKNNIAKLVTREAIERAERKLADEYDKLLNNPKGSARLEAEKRKDPKKFDRMKKAHDKYYGKGK
jgi:hypothetical protein